MLFKFKKKIYNLFTILLNVVNYKLLAQLLIIKIIFYKKLSKLYNFFFKVNILVFRLYYKLAVLLKSVFK